MSKYSMSSAKDLNRLEKQNDQKQYSLDDELCYLNFNDGDYVLDAGCGSGLVTRAMAEMVGDKNIKFEACDYSDVAVQGASKNFENAGIPVKTFKSSLDNIQSEDNYYDKVICRYVLEHMSNPNEAVNEFHRILKDGGEAYLIDVEGMVFNLFSQNQKLNNYLNSLKISFNFDLFVGRKLTQYLSNSGFKEISWNASTMAFNTKVERNLEIQNYESRFNLAKPIIVEALGSENKYDEFVSMYLQEATKLENILYYTKFVATGKK